MKLRRILSLILACSLAVTMFTVIPAAAADTVITQDNPSGTLTITLKIKGTASVTTAPTAKEGLTTSNGAAVELLEIPGTAEGGTMAYSLNGTDYSADIPTADAAGTYTVYYKAIGDEDHNDSEAQTLTVTVGASGALTITLVIEEPSYTITWKNWDGTVIETDENVLEGADPTYDGEEPTKRAGRVYMYTFNGWTPEVVAVAGDAEYTAVFNSEEITVPHGPQADGTFYWLGEKQKAYSLIELEGDYYLVSEYNKYAKDQLRYLNASMVEGTDFTVGYYWFDEEGHMQPVRTGPMADGYFYKDNERLNAYQLVEFEGDWYYISTNNKFTKNSVKNLSGAVLEGTPFSAGKFEFGPDGKMIVKNGPNEDGCFYIYNVRQKAYKLVEFEGGWYFVAENNKYVKSVRRYLNASMVEGTGFAAGYYEFDADGKMIYKQGPDADGYFYLNNEKQKAYKLINFDNSYYLVAEYHKYAKSQTRYLNASMVEGTDFAVGFYDFDADGRMILAD